MPWLIGQQEARTAPKRKHMLTTTIEIIRSGLKGDPSLSARERALIMAMLRGGIKSPTAEPTTCNEVRLVGRKEAARRLGRSLRFVDRLAQDGILPKRRLPHRQRAAGFLESDLVALIAK
jgi:hypothetical protein